jgi:hypothetical protein
MLEISSLGHATLIVRTEETTILCDPILGDSVSGGGNIIHPKRTLLLDRLPPLDAVLISHHHSDHFSLSDLEFIPEIRSKRIIAPKKSIVIEELHRFGCCHVEGIQVGQSVHINNIIVTATPSAVDFPEVGFLFQSSGFAALNLVDSQIHGVLDQLLAILDGPVQLVLAPFQSGGYMSLLPLRVDGPPKGLIEAIDRWATEHTEELVADLTLIGPEFIVPFADGLIYVDKGINAWHFPLPDEVFLEKMAQQGIPGSQCAPGMVFSLSQEGVAVKTASCNLVRTENKDESPRVFNPSTQIKGIPMSCADWMPRLHQTTNSLPDLCVILQDQAAKNLANFASAGSSPDQIGKLLNWYLEFCDCPEETHYLYAEEAHEGLTARLEEVVPCRAYGLRLHAKDLFNLLEGNILLEHITLGGAFRYHSPENNDNLESIRGNVFGPLDIILGIA